ncbi:MAG: S1C family serine protease, partial [Chitinophagales bacterium]
MKRTFQLVLAAVLGSVITLTAYQMTGLNQKTVIFQDSKGEASPAALTNYNATVSKNQALDSKIGPADFTYAAEKTTPAVVHIKSTQKARVVSGGGGRQDMNPFKDFFGDGFDEFFFGPNGRGRGGQPQPRVGTGSGVIIGANGYIVTNNHVIEGADEIEVTLHDNQKYVATLVGTDPSTDIALLKVEGTNLPTLELA